MDNGASSYHRFLSGDDTGLKEIIDEYYDGLVLYLNNYLNNLSESEEMAEETLFVLVTKKPHFRGQSSFKTWLYSIGRNLTIDHIRHNAHEMPAEVSEQDYLLADSVLVEQNYIREEDKRQIHRAMQHLQAEYRQVLWLKYFEDMSAQEIAKVMKKTVYSINHLLKRAKKKLREQMEKEGFCYEES